MDEIIIREAEENDCKAVMALIKDLASYEKMGKDVKLTEDALKADGFGEQKFFHAFVAEIKDSNDGGSSSQIIGFALYFYLYSTWEGRAAQIEDLFVKEKFRSKGIGTSLFKAVAKKIREMGCSRLDLHCLNWNTPSIGFYKHLGATDLTEREGWHLFRFKENVLDKLNWLE